MIRLICKLIGHKWTKYIEDPSGEYYVRTCRRCESRDYMMPTAERTAFRWRE